MEHEFESLGDRELVAVIDAALDALSRDRVGMPSEHERLKTVAAALRTQGRLRTWIGRQLAKLDAEEVVWREHGTSAATWLGESHRLTRREAGHLIRSGHHLHRFARVGAACEQGVVSPEQAEAITQVLDQLPEEFDTQQMADAQEMMVGFARTHTSSELRQLTAHLVEVLDPVSADEREAVRLERERKKARRNRYLKFTDTHDGSVLIRGSLPVAEAESFRKIVDAHLAQVPRGLDRADPDAEYLTPAIRRADALMAMVHAHQRQRTAPACGGDRPRVVVTIDHDNLKAAAAGTGFPVGRISGSNQAVAASVMRQWLCDADVMPAVLGGASEVLDLGRSRRLVTAALRRALELRDRGCVFPGCDKPPAACEAHHIIPWWDGGVTALHNLVLVCPHHHGVVEPGRDPTADRWRIEIGPDTIPRVIPPWRVDRSRRPRSHARFHDGSGPAGRPPLEVA